MISNYFINRKLSVLTALACLVALCCTSPIYGDVISVTGDSSETWTIDGSTYTGVEMNLSAGSAATHSGSFAINSDATVTIAAGNTLTQSKAVSGVATTGLTKTGAGTLVYTVAPTYTGNTTISEGSLRLSDVAVATSGKTFSIAENAVLALGIKAADRNFSSTVTGNGNIIITGETKNKRANFTSATLSGFSGKMYICDGGEVLTSGTQSTLGGEMPNIYVGVNENGTLSSGQLYVNSSNTYTGTYTIYGTGAGDGLGAIRLQAGATLAGSVNLAGDASITSYGLTGKVTAQLNLNSHVLTSGTGTTMFQTITDGVTTDSVTISNGTLKYTSSNASGQNINIESDGVLEFTLSTLNAATIMGSGRLRLVGTGAAAERYSNKFTYDNFTGALEISSFRLQASSFTTIDNINDIIVSKYDAETNGGQFYAPGNGKIFTHNYYIVGTGPDKYGAIRMQGGCTIDGTVTLTGDATISDYHSGASNSKLAATVDLQGNTLTFGAVVTNNGTIDLSGAITSNTTPGNIVLSTPINLVDPSVPVTEYDGTGGTWNLNGKTLSLNSSATKVRLGALAGSGTLTNTATFPITLELGGSNQDATTDVVLEDGASSVVSLVKTGTGTQTLTGTSTFTGGTTISAGAVSVSSDENLGASTGSLTLNGGTLKVTETIDTSRAIALSANSTIEVVAEKTFTTSSALSANYTLTKTGTGELTLTTAPASALSISEGVVNMNVDTTTSGVTLTNNATYNFGNNPQTLNNLAGTTASALINGIAAITLHNTEDSAYTGNITSGGITVTGTADKSLKINGTITTSSIVMNSGNLDIKGVLLGNLEVNDGGVFSPGNSIGKTEQTGDFILNSGATIKFELSAVDNDWLTVSGTAKFATGSIIDLDYLGGLPATDKSYELLSAGTLTLTQSDFNWDNILTEAGLNTTDWAWDFSDNKKIVLNYTKPAIPIPEPSTWVLFILGSLGLCGLRRKK